MPRLWFRLWAYRREDGECPVWDFLREHGRSNQRGRHFLIAHIRAMRDGDRQRPPAFKLLPGTGLWEIRVLQTGARVLGFTRPNRLMVLLIGTVKKKDELPHTIVAKAQAYRQDYLKRCTEDEDTYDEEF